MAQRISSMTYVNGLDPFKFVHGTLTQGTKGGYLLCMTKPLKQRNANFKFSTSLTTVVLKSPPDLAYSPPSAVANGIICLEMRHLVVTVSRELWVALLSQSKDLDERSE
ncbi:hypothetical protein EGR_06131 [Echinococcus granulosus]|uniref:Uncharacterized protein n=1 Tax=Echinococcus granulosus TaxID=6210 RepID=W6UCL7_ECHGR|nr:hypothetical protein EGR_06131 [Echinococcus granulosus]EUB59015.1 hypothetical protein EGR_06131 [Echinococcus granulosus]